MDYAQKTMVLTVGNELKADDSAGPALARMLEEHPIDGLLFIDGGMVPENTTSYIRRCTPEHLVIVDAAQLGLPAGSIRRVYEEDIAEQLFITTHNMPLSFLMDNIKEAVGRITFLGIQPANLTLFDPIGPEASAAVEQIYAWLRDGYDLEQIPDSRQ